MNDVALKSGGMKCTLLSLCSLVALLGLLAGPVAGALLDPGITFQGRLLDASETGSRAVQFANLVRFGENRSDVETIVMRLAVGCKRLRP